jgi:DNA-binding winged helix-turn-helix (wHTH) protein/tetratricopeptide (TPR) repeat protein
MKVFPPFRLDTVNQCLWRGDTRITLVPKVFAVLTYLVEHSGRLVTQDELLEAIWPETYVQPEVLRTYILELRKILGDRPKESLFIATFPKRGYQFVAPVSEDGPGRALDASSNGQTSPVGRQSELAQMEGYLEKAFQGQRQVVWVTGEAGIGKTTLIDAFQRRVAHHRDVRVARGQCVEGFGGKEAYYPVLEALGQMVRGPGAEPTIATLALHAPTWLIQFPSLVTVDQREALQREILGATRERMVREICVALEVMTARSPLVLLLEDLHAVDPSTLDLVSALARRREAAQLLLIGSYRPVEVVLLQSPLKALKQDLTVHRLCHEIALERLAESDVAQYLSVKFPGDDLAEGMAKLIYRHSEGNPLFMTVIVADLVKNGFLAVEGGHPRMAAPLESIELGVPETLQQMIEMQVDQLSEQEQRLVKSASVAGQRFSAWALAAMLEMDVAAAEEECERLAHTQQFIRPGRESGAPGAAISAQYEFRHSLYRESLYRRLPVAQRTNFHRRLAEKMETLYTSARPDAVLELASELALHFENGRDYERATRYLIFSAENAGRRYAHRDSITILQQGFALLAQVSSDSRRALEIEILERTSDAHYALGEMEASAEVDRRTAALAGDYGMKTAQVNALTRVARVLAFLDPDGCVAVCEQAAAICTTLDDPVLQARTEMLAACWRIINNGWRKEDADICTAAREKIRDLKGADIPASYEILYAHVQSIQGDYVEAYQTAEAGIPKSIGTHSLVVYLSALSSQVLALFQLGRWGELRRVIQTGLDLAEKNRNDPWLGIFQAYLAWLHLNARDFEGASKLSQMLLQKYTEEPAGQVQTMARVTSGLADINLGQPEAAIAKFTKVRNRPKQPKFFLQWYWETLAEVGLPWAWLMAGQPEKAAVEADQYLRDALVTADPSLRAMAWSTEARVALAKDDSIRAKQCIDQALACMRNFEPRIPALRVHLAAAAVYQRSGEDQRAERHRRRVLEIQQELANSLEEGDPLRASLLAPRKF